MSPRKAAPPDEWLSVPAIAAMFGLDKSQVYKWLRRGHLAYIRLPSEGEGEGPIRVDPADLAAFIKNRRVPATT